MRPAQGFFATKKSSARRRVFLLQKIFRPVRSFLATKKSPARRRAFLPQKISHPARSLLATKKSSARHGTFLPQKKSSARRGAFLLQKNLPPGAEPSCYRKIFRPVRGLLATKKSPARTDGRFFFFSNSRQSASEPLITIRRSHISWPFPTSGWL